MFRLVDSSCLAEDGKDEKGYEAEREKEKDKKRIKKVAKRSAANDEKMQNFFNNGKLRRLERCKTHVFDQEGEFIVCRTKKVITSKERMTEKKQGGSKPTTIKIGV